MQVFSRSWQTATFRISITRASIRAWTYSARASICITRRIADIAGILCFGTWRSVKIYDPLWRLRRFGARVLYHGYCRIERQVPQLEIQEVFEFVEAAGCAKFVSPTATCRSKDYTESPSR